MIVNEIGYAYKDVSIIPQIISKISSRKQCNCFTKDGMLPIFASPMASVIDDQNYKIFEENKIYTIIPRNIPLNTRLQFIVDGHFVALSLKEFIDIFVNHTSERYILRYCNKPQRYKICVDIANGHMKHLYEYCVKAKQIAEDSNIYSLELMVGNIANPKTYEYICNNALYFDKNHKKRIAVDYVRIGIGGGSGCITSSNLGCHYPQATLIDKINNYRNNIHFNEDDFYKVETPKIVADGGIRNFDDVIKALALGADFVMIGGLMSRMIESCGQKFINTNKVRLPFPIERYEKSSLYYEDGKWYGKYTQEFINKNCKPWNGDDVNQRRNELSNVKCIGEIYVKFFGMASRDGQLSIDGKKTKTAEGITKYFTVDDSLVKWAENMEDYLRSIMSYCNSTNLNEFIGNQTLIINSLSEINAVNK